MSLNTIIFGEMNEEFISLIQKALPLKIGRSTGQHVITVALEQVSLVLRDVKVTNGWT
jgi:hypothetical protein